MLKIHAVNSDRLKPEVLAIAEKVKAEGYPGKKYSSVEEWQKDMDAEEAMERKTIKGKVKYFWKDFIYYPLYRPIHRLLDIPDDLIAFWQRGRCGFATRDCWGLDSYLSSWMPEALMTMVMKEKGGGNTYPGVKGAETPEKWEAIVKEIADGFRAGRQIDDLPYRDQKTYQAAEKRLLVKQKQGLKLFQIWFNSLWD